MRVSQQTAEACWQGQMALRILAAIGLLIALSASAGSQDLDLGRTEFLSKCAMCHGADGRGAGPLSTKLKVQPANLTMIAKNNHGVFSPEVIYKIIDGREKTTSPHSTEMPMWGCRHPGPTVSRKNRHQRTSATPPASRKKAVTLTPDSFLDLPCESEPVIRNRLTAIVEYLRQIQDK